MRRTMLVAVVALAAFAGPSAASTSAPTAEVISTATIVMHVGTNTFTNFEFVIRNCPEGDPVTITWEATQPAKGDTSTGHGDYFSGPDATQHFVLTTVGAFSPGYRWVGSGTVTCGAIAIPVTGSGATKIVS